jgi:hypothetical protein
MNHVPSRTNNYNEGNASNERPFPRPEEFTMRRLLLFLVLVLVVVVGVGYYRDWFTINTTQGKDDQKIHMGVDIDKAKIKEDANKAKEKAKELEQDVKDKVKK